MIYCFDIDGTICTQEPDSQTPYNEATPFMERVARINELYDQGHTILLQTARGTTTGIDWKEFTEQQLRGWGVKYNELIFGKLNADVFIDDKGVSADVFFEG